MNVGSKLIDVLRRSVGQGALGVRPYVFGRVQLRGIAGETIHVQPTAALGHVIPDELRVVDGPAVPDHNDRTAYVSLQAAEKPEYLDTADVLAVELDVQAQAGSAGRDRKGRDGGDAVPSIAVAQQRRLAFGRPGASNRRDQEKAAFVDESEVGAQPFRFFLIRTQSLVFHCAMAASSRCVARRSGFCVLQFMSTTSNRLIAEME